MTFQEREKKCKRHRVLKDSTESGVEFGKVCTPGKVDHGMEGEGKLLIE